MKNSYFIPAFVLVWLLLSSDACGYKSKLILGFEIEELASKRGESWCEIKGVDDGCDFWANFEFGAGDRIWTWQCRKGDSTEGVQALVSSVQPGLAHASFLRTAFQQRYYPILRKSAAEASVILNTFQWLAYTQPDLRDWSDYDLLWVDFKTDRPLTVWLTLEDEIIEPPVVRTFDVPANEWVTLELDLKAAERIRGLDLKQITNIYVIGKTSETAGVRVDNVRIVQKGTPNNLEVLQDKTFMKAPTFKFGSKPVIRNL